MGGRPAGRKTFFGKGRTGPAAERIRTEVYAVPHTKVIKGGYAVYAHVRYNRLKNPNGAELKQGVAVKRKGPITRRTSDREAFRLFITSRGYEFDSAGRIVNRGRKPLNKRDAEKVGALVRG